jgi:hypothetical protein
MRRQPGHSRNAPLQRLTNVLSCFGELAAVDRGNRRGPANSEARRGSELGPRNCQQSANWRARFWRLPRKRALDFEGFFAEVGSTPSPLRHNYPERAPRHRAGLWALGRPLHYALWQLERGWTADAKRGHKLQDLVGPDSTLAQSRQQICRATFKYRPRVGCLAALNQTLN